MFCSIWWMLRCLGPSLRWSCGFPHFHVVSHRNWPNLSMFILSSPLGGCINLKESQRLGYCLSWPSPHNSLVLSLTTKTILNQSRTLYFYMFTSKSTIVPWQNSEKSHVRTAHNPKLKTLSKRLFPKSKSDSRIVICNWHQPRGTRGHRGLCAAPGAERGAVPWWPALQGAGRSLEVSKKTRRIKNTTHYTWLNMIN